MCSLVLQKRNGSKLIVSVSRDGNQTAAPDPKTYHGSLSTSLPQNGNGSVERGSTEILKTSTSSFLSSMPLKAPYDLPSSMPLPSSKSSNSNSTYTWPYAKNESSPPSNIYASAGSRNTITYGRTEAECTSVGMTLANTAVGVEVVGMYPWGSARWDGKIEKGDIVSHVEERPTHGLNSQQVSHPFVSASATGFFCE